MKNILIAATFIAIAFIAPAQKWVSLKIDHMIEGSTFEMNTTFQSSSGYDYNVTFLKYYLSGFELIHDGGQVTVLPDTWLLVDASREAEYMLGQFNVTEIEKIRFAVGVDSAHNHLDPATWPSGHPLAHQTPTMHWGWTPGYRFLVVEGRSGNNLAQIYQIHALGDRNYEKFDVPGTASVDGDTLIVDLNAHYNGLFSEMDISAGVISHSELGESQQALTNMRSEVFESENPPVSVGEIPNLHLLQFQNPALPGNIDVISTHPEPLELRILNSTGQLVHSTKVKGSFRVNLDAAGVYFLELSSNGKPVSNEKLMVR